MSKKLPSVHALQMPQQAREDPMREHPTQLVSVGAEGRKGGANTVSVLYGNKTDLGMVEWWREPI